MESVCLATSYPGTNLLRLPCLTLYSSYQNTNSGISQYDEVITAWPRRSIALSISPRRRKGCEGKPPRILNLSTGQLHSIYWEKATAWLGTGWGRVGLGETERDWVRSSGSVKHAGSGWNQLGLGETECVWVRPSVSRWDRRGLGETDWVWVKPTGSRWDRLGLGETERDWVRSNGSGWGRVGLGRIDWVWVKPRGTGWNRVGLSAEGKRETPVPIQVPGGSRSLFCPSAE
jgi:hypothetical protein